MHHIIFPRTLKPATIVPDVSASTVHLVIDELTVITTSILPLEQTMAVFLALLVIACIGCAIGPVFFASPVVLIIEPVTLVRCTILVEVGAFTIRFVVFPEADIDIAISVDDPAEAFLSIIDKVAIVARAIRPDLGCTPMTNCSRPFASVTHAILDLLHILLHNSEAFLA